MPACSEIDPQVFGELITRINVRAAGFGNVELPVITELP